MPSHGRKCESDLMPDGVENDERSSPTISGHNEAASGAPVGASQQEGLSRRQKKDRRPGCRTSTSRDVATPQQRTSSAPGQLANPLRHQRRYAVGNRHQRPPPKRTHLSRHLNPSLSFILRSHTRAMLILGGLSAMKLFNDIVRDDSPAKNTERLYPFLNRSSWPECDRSRSLCEDWFSRYPAGDRKDLHSRFTSRRDDDHQGAYFELLLHELLIRLGGILTVEPSVPGTTKRPDFLVELGGTRFYLEAKVEHAKKDDIGVSPIFDEVCDLINSIDVPNHIIHILFSDPPTNMPSKASIIAQIERLIQQSDGEVTQRQLFDNGRPILASGFLQLDDAYARVRLIPYSGKERSANEHRNVIRSTGGVAHQVAPEWRESIRLKAKSKTIEQYDAPCVIAVDVLDGFARIGDEGVQAVYNLHGDSARQGGLWTSADGSSWRHNLAAVWMFRYALPVQESPSGAEDCWFVNPYNIQALPPSLTQLTRAETINGSLIWSDGLVLDELLDVPEIMHEDRRRRRFLDNF